ncbi:MAG: ATP-dependent helicase [Candidatus Nanohaloarchaeota archaeon]|nr:ATP-dependent helicase [Candidatus Nanohaloarchaeota archaeon]
MSSVYLLEKEYSKEEILNTLDDVVKEWFLSKFKDFTPPQRYSIMNIHKKNNILISSPTGSGKTLSAFLAIINELVVLARNNMLEDKVYAIYVSPLKALNNDIEKNLQEPLSEIQQLFKKKSIDLQEIRIGKRTGDVNSYERQKQLKNPPHILITTPESLSILLVSPKFSEKIRDIEYLIIDEIHSLAENKRGTHLMLSVERLAHYKEFTRIGLSATVAPLEEVGKFLIGNDPSRSCGIIDVSYTKKIKLYVYSPVEDLIYAENEYLQEKFYATLDKLIEQHRTTLIFTNTRAGTEKIVHHLKSKYKEKYENLIEAHHGSLSKEVRLEVEKKLKEGKLKCVVTSTSLELGIDIGYVDLVILIGSPKSIARALQRIGRAGHKLHETSKGVFIALNRDDLVEVTVMAKKALERKIDKIHIPQNALDVLAQHIVGMAIEKKWKVKEAYTLITKAYPYRNLKYEDFLNTLKYLAGGYESLEDSNVYAKIWWDEEEGIFGKKGKNIRMIYYTNIGTIPDEAMIKVKDVSGKYIGKVEEEFVENLKLHDRFVLGGKVYEFLGSRGTTIRARLTEDLTPTVPSWFSEQLPLSYDLALDIGEFRSELKYMIESMTLQQLISHLKHHYPISSESAQMIAHYFLEQHKYLEIPTKTTIIIEEYFDERGRQNFIFHTLIGRRANEVLSRAYAFLISSAHKINIGIAVHDNGFIITLPSSKRINIEPYLDKLTPNNLEEIIKRAIKKTEIIKRRFRHIATRGLLVLRSYAGKQKSVHRQAVTSWMLYKMLEEADPNFPLIKEVFREVLEDVMDIHSAKDFLNHIHTHKWKFKVKRNLEVPSPFSHNMVVLGDSDVVLMQSKRELIKLLHKQIMHRIKEHTS